MPDGSNLMASAWTDSSEKSDAVHFIYSSVIQPILASNGVQQTLTRLDFTYKCVRPKGELHDD